MRNKIKTLCTTTVYRVTCSDVNTKTGLFLRREARTRIILSLIFLFLKKVDAIKSIKIIPYKKKVCEKSAFQAYYTDFYLYKLFVHMFCKLAVNRARLSCGLWRWNQTQRISGLFFSSFIVFLLSFWCRNMTKSVGSRDLIRGLT